MAELQKEEYKFPDEIENKAISVDTPDFEVEVEDEELSAGMA